jgi:hypothetical protein
MTLIPGTVSVDSAGNETFTPNDATNNAKALYAMLLTSASSITMTQKVSHGSGSYDPTTGIYTPPPPPTTQVVTKSVTPDPTTKQKQAELANLLATWIVTMMTTNASVSVSIPNTTAGDGLQTTTTNGNPTTHPSTTKNLSGVIQ